jgi:hypothetical protein
VLLTRGGVRITRGLGPTMTARGQSIGISIGILPQTLIMSRLDQLSRIGARINFFIIHTKFSLFMDNLRPEARDPLKSGAWGGSPTCHPQPPSVLPTLALLS